MEEFIRLYQEDGHNSTPIITETTKTKKNLQRHDEKSNLNIHNSNININKSNIHNSNHYHDVNHHSDSYDKIQLNDRIKQCCHDGFISWKNMMNKAIVIQARTLVNAHHDDYYNNKDNDNDHIIHSSIPQVDECIHSSLSHFMLNHQDSTNNNNNSTDDNIYDYIMGHSLPPPASSLLSSTSHTATSISALIEMINTISTTQNDEGNICACVYMYIHVLE